MENGEWHDTENYEPNGMEYRENQDEGKMVLLKNEKVEERGK